MTRSDVQRATQSAGAQTRPPIAGKLDPMAAFPLGKLQLEGDLGVAMKLGTLMRR